MHVLKPRRFWWSLPLSRRLWTKDLTHVQRGDCSSQAGVQGRGRSVAAQDAALLPLALLSLALCCLCKPAPCLCALHVLALHVRPFCAVHACLGVQKAEQA